MTGDRHLRIARPAEESDDPVVPRHPFAELAAVNPEATLELSPEPRVVFTSLAATCVPLVCDHCEIDLFDGEDERTRLVVPPEFTSQVSERVSGNVITVPFDHVDADLPALDDPPRTDHRSHFRGVARFGWHDRIPTPQDRTVVALLVQHAVQTVVWQRGVAAEQAAVSEIEGLRLALQSSRDIGAAVGILMGLHKITKEQSFELLRQASQRSNIKLRALALDVLDTGWLDPQLIDPGAAAHGGSGSPGRRVTSAPSTPPAPGATTIATPGDHA